jgi:hypothetical protein
MELFLIRRDSAQVGIGQPLQNFVFEGPQPSLCHLRRVEHGVLIQEEGDRLLKIAGWGEEPLELLLFSVPGFPVGIHPFPPFTGKGA